MERVGLSRKRAGLKKVGSKSRPRSRGKRKRGKTAQVGGHKSSKQECKTVSKGGWKRSPDPRRGLGKKSSKTKKGRKRKGG